MSGSLLFLMPFLLYALIGGCAILTAIGWALGKLRRPK